MLFKLRSLFYAAFMRYGQDQSGAASVENAVLWGVLGVIVTSSGWALYHDVADVAQESSDHSERRDSMTTLSKTQKRAKISNPAAPQALSGSNDSRIHTSPGNDVAPEPYEPWNEVSTVSLVYQRQLLFRGSNLPHGEAYRNIQASASLDYKGELHDKCMAPVAGADAYSLATYIGDDFNAANKSGCLFTRTIFVTNNKKDFIPLYTTTMDGDLDSTSFVGSFFPDQLIQWTSSQRADCDPLWNRGGRSITQEVQSCRDSFNDPIQNPECYSQDFIFSPSLCGAAPVLNSVGETIMWRSYFESEPISWRKPVDLKKVGTLGQRYTPYMAVSCGHSCQSFIPNAGRVAPYLSDAGRDTFVPYIPSTNTVDIIKAKGELSLLPPVNPGCPQSDNLGTATDYEWDQNCNPTLSTSRLSARLDG